MKTEQTVISMSIGNEYIEETFSDMRKGIESLNNMIKRQNIDIDEVVGRFSGRQDFGDGIVAEIRGIHTSIDKLPVVEIPTDFVVGKSFSDVVVTFPSEGVRITCNQGRAVVDYETDGNFHDSFEISQLLRAAYQIFKTQS
jgi:hypothetical protein